VATPSSFWEFLGRSWSLFERTVLRILWAALVVLAFTVVLMTATAQQRVTTLLSERPTDERIDYSSAWAKVQDDERQQAELAKLRTRQRALATEEQAARLKLREAEVAANQAWNRFAPIAARVMANPECGDVGSPDHLSIWDWVVQCQATATLPDRLKRQAADVIAAVPNVEQTERDAQATQRNIETLEVTLKAVAADVEVATKAAADAQSLRSTFSELNVLRDSWLLGRGLFVQFPPTLLQFILALTAGMFGALLVTLVLAVYPRHDFQFMASEGYFKRILLGGMIALCVYIVLGGGSAILGSADPFTGGEANVMTFSAVGVLAGMFSDKVAGWLSKRADGVFAAAPPAPGMQVADSDPPPPT